MLVYIALLALVAGGIGAVLYRRKMFRDLKWPRNLGHVEFRTKAQRYFIYRGWQADENWNGIDYLVRKNDTTFALRCHVDDDDLLMRTASDLFMRSVTSPKALAVNAIPLVLCAKEVSPFLIEEALRKRVYVIPLRRLFAFTALQTLSPAAVRSFVQEELAEIQIQSTDAPISKQPVPSLFPVSKQDQA